MVSGRFISRLRVRLTVARQSFDRAYHPAKEAVDGALAVNLNGDRGQLGGDRQLVSRRPHMSTPSHARVSAEVRSRLARVGIGRTDRRRSNSSTASGGIRYRGRAAVIDAMFTARSSPRLIHASTRCASTPQRRAKAGGVRYRAVWAIAVKPAHRARGTECVRAHARRQRRPTRVPITRTKPS
jgi:hypothetical protein